MDPQRSAMEAPPPVKVVRERMPWSRCLAAALSMNFETIHDLPNDEQRRVGLLGLPLGAAVTVVGLAVFGWLAKATGVSTKLFGLIAGWGGLIAGINSYRVGVSFFPGLRGNSTLASLSRMLFVLIVLSGLGALGLYVLLRDAR